MADENRIDGENQKRVEARPLTPEAQRALAEAQERRLLAEARSMPKPQEFDGPSGPEPIRYGDWERKGIASDF